MVYHQYAAPAAVAGLGYHRRRGMYGLNGETEVVPVQPYYDRYKVSVPAGTGQAVQGLSGEEVTRANYLQTNGLGADVSPDGQPLWPQDEETPEVGTWIS